MPYSERYDGYSLSKGVKRTTGTRVFVAVDEASASTVATLPLIGVDLMVTHTGASVSNCILKTIQTNYEENVAVFTCSYDTDDTEVVRIGGFVLGSNKEDSFYVSVDTAVFEDPGKAWAFENGTNAVEYPIGKEIPIFNFTITERNIGHAAFNSRKNEVRAKAGCINDEVFMDWPEGSVKFNGASGSRYTDSDGDYKYEVRYEFAARVLVDDNGGVVDDSWLYDWNNAAGGGWDKPKKGSSYKYKKAAFSFV